MATLDDSPQLYLGQPWNIWADKLEGKHKDGSSNRDDTQPQKRESNAMKLRKTDMPLYGHCPAQDEFFLVVCKTCGQVIKPQALQRHIEHRHGSKMPCRMRTSSISPVKVDSTAGSTASDKNLTESSHSSLKHDPHGKTPPNIRAKGGTKERSPSPNVNLESHLSKSNAQLSSHTKRNHSVMPVVKVQRMPDLIAGTKKNVSATTHSTSKSSPSSKSSTSKSSAHSKSSKSSSKSAFAGSSSKSSLSATSKEPSNGSLRSESPLPKTPDPKGVTVIAMSPIEMPPPALSPILTTIPPVVPASQCSPPPTSPVIPSARSVVLSPGVVTAKPVLPTSTSATNGPPKLPSAASGTSKAKSIKPNPNKIIPCKDREFDVNTHCGVFVPETGKQCTRSLTCKTHALSLRRAVTGRRKPFDELLREHRATKEAYLKAKAIASGKPYIPPGSSSKSSAGGHHHSSSTSSGAATPHAATSHMQHHKLAPAPACPTSPVTMTTLTKLPKPALPLPPRTVPLPVVPKEEPIPETCSRLSSDGEDDADEDRDKVGYPHLPYHPRPAAVNNFGSRLAGNGCYVFNRRTDLLRAAFMVAVERHLHPPPHKKLCVESKLPQGSQITTNSKDPYEFPEGQNAQYGAWGHARFLNKSKMKPAMPPGRTIKPKDAPGSRSPGGSGGSTPVFGTNLNMVQTTSHPLANIQGGSATLKRKRSGSGSSSGSSSGLSNSGGVTGATTLASLPGGLTVSSSNGSPISISLPPGQLKLSAINAAVSLASKSHPLGSHTLVTSKNHMLKDLNIVVTSMEPSAVVNGQIVSSQLTHSNSQLPSTQLTDLTQLQLNQLVERSTTASKTSKSHKAKHLKTAHTTATLVDGVVPSSMVQTLQGGTVMLDQSGNLLNVVSSGMSPPELSPANMPSQLGSSTAYVSQASPLANGLLTSANYGQLKTMQLNHVAAGALASPSSNRSPPSPSSADSASAHHHTQSHQTKPQAGRHRKASSNSQAALSAPQLSAGATIAVAAPQGQGRLQGPTMFYTNSTMLGPTATVPFSHIQIQPRTSASKTTGKLSMQPVSLTIPVMAQSGVNLATPQQPARTLLLQDDRRTHDLSQQMTNSPSNLIS